MIDHVTVAVSDLDRSRRFYEAALAPLDYKVSFGEAGQFWAFDVHDGLFEIMTTDQPGALPRMHVAFRARSRLEVNAFHAAALAAGGQDNGPPGPRPHYAEHYYAAFVLEPDGYNIEAMINHPTM